MNGMHAVAVFLGGGLGSVLRFGLAQAFMNKFLWGVPLSTLLSNMLASLIVGLVWLVGFREKNPSLYMLLATGFCGGLSTFSTFSQENVLLWARWGPGPVVLNIAFNVILCSGIVYVLTRHLVYRGFQ
ncbi:MAG: CrcB family protein [Flavobacteriales bacterium]|nr:CrcB family protein [Flavobacteriales bacterium]MCX7768508.1 CrcB family protein [Flavobacteriales bacterium]MDW8409840.1 CrcB family protein [Flavobacteriales bacterium]